MLVISSLEKKIIAYQQVPHYRYRHDLILCNFLPLVSLTWTKNIVQGNCSPSQHVILSEVAVLQFWL